MDLSSIKMKEESWIDITDPAGDPTDMRICIVSKDSSTFKKAQRKISETERRRGKGLKPAEQEQLWLELLAKCTVNWENIVENKKIVECNYDNALDIYTRYNFITEQVIAQIGDRENFLEN